MEDMLNLDMSNLQLKNGITLAELSSGSEFELQKEDTFYDIKENDQLNKEEFDRIYNSNSHSDEEDLNPIDLASTSFQEIAKNMKNISPDGGVMKKLLKRGYGPLVAENSIIDVHYNAYFEYSDDPFDSSHLRNQSFKYKMGSGRAIPGWEIALLTMSKGEKSRFLIRPDYGFREIGCPPRVPQNATALFIIELLNISDQIGINDFYLLNEDDRHQVSFDYINKLVHSEKLQGTKFFTQKQFKKAFNKYKQAANLLESCHLESDKEERECQRILVDLNLNMALCCLRLTHSTRAITYSRKVLNMDKNNAKALFRLGQAFHQLGQFNEAKKYLCKAQKILPKDSSIQKELKQVKENEQKFQFIEADVYKKMLSGLETNKKDVSTAESPVSESDAVSKEFQNSVTKYLENFADDKCQDECPLPTYSMSEAEMNFVLETVHSMSLNVVQSGSGQNSTIRITKNIPSFQDEQVLLS
ncbi:FKBP6 [Acanthosepion pharaonis]|uniref:peptidylprolyl isomerase n=1 Tax=Acanthosepion pharaonis TaxID=158019 RepID=A0A812D2C6_ACAPH|nr:FKBP6 [Sepia pharaonis]